MKSYTKIRGWLLLISFLDSGFNYSFGTDEYGCVRIIIADGMNCELRDNFEYMMRGNFHANYEVLYASDALINTSIAVFSYRAFKNRQYPEK